MLSRNQRSQAGLTLTELLCTMAIIMVLAGLLLGPASRVLRRVRADEWGEKSATRLQTTVEQLKHHFEGQQNFPLVTLKKIEANHWVNALELDFLKDRRVTFIPFADSDPDEKTVIQVIVDRGYWTEAGLRLVAKGDITGWPESSNPD